MADTIADKVQSLTGVTTADTEFMDMGKKLIVNSVPPNMLTEFAVEVAATNDNGISIPDVVLSVRRGARVCKKIPDVASYAAEAAYSSSLYAPTTFSPIYYDRTGLIFVKPTPTTAPNNAIVVKVDYTDITADSMFDHVIALYASAMEMGKLAAVSRSAIKTILDEQFDDSADALFKIVTDALDIADKFINEAQTFETSYTAHSAGYHLAGDDPEMSAETIRAAAQEVARAANAGNIMQGVAASIQGYLNQMTQDLQRSRDYYTWAMRDLQGMITKNVPQQEAQPEQQQGRK